MQATPRQFRHAGPMRMKKNTSDASMMIACIRQATSRYPRHIKYIAMYKLADATTMVLAGAHDKLSVTQWRAMLGTGIQEIMPTKDLKGEINLAKQQEGFEEYGSVGKQHGVKPRAAVLTHVDASLEQMVHVQLLPPPVEEPVDKKAEMRVEPQPKIVVSNKKITDHPSKRIVEKFAERRKQRAAQDPARHHPYMMARMSFLKTQEELRRQKKLPLKPPADLRLADYHAPSTTTRSSLNGKDIMHQGRVLAREAYLKANEDYSLGRMSQRISMRSTFEKQAQQE